MCVCALIEAQMVMLFWKKRLGAGAMIDSAYKKLNHQQKHFDGEYAIEKGKLGPKSPVADGIVSELAKAEIDIRKAKLAAMEMRDHFPRSIKVIYPDDGVHLVPQVYDQVNQLIAHRKVLGIPDRKRYVSAKLPDGTMFDQSNDEDGRDRVGHNKVLPLNWNRPGALIMNRTKQSHHSNNGIKVRYLAHAVCALALEAQSEVMESFMCHEPVLTFLDLLASLAIDYFVDRSDRVYWWIPWTRRAPNTDIALPDWIATGEAPQRKHHAVFYNRPDITTLDDWKTDAGPDSETLRSAVEAPPSVDDTTTAKGKRKKAVKGKTTKQASATAEAPATAVAAVVVTKGKQTYKSRSVVNTEDERDDDEGQERKEPTQDEASGSTADKGKGRATHGVEQPDYMQGGVMDGAKLMEKDWSAREWHVARTHILRQVLRLPQAYMYCEREGSVNIRRQYVDADVAHAIQYLGSVSNVLSLLCDDDDAHTS